MNFFENWFCASALWRRITERHILPWVLADCDLGEHILEIGAGSGAATEALRRRARVTSVEYDARSASKLSARIKCSCGDVVRGDASSLPFANQIFSSAIAILMLHHLRSVESQDRAFAEIFRVLRPGGVFLAFEISDSWFHRIGHVRSTFVPVVPATAYTRLAQAGFSEVTLGFSGGAFRIRAMRPSKN
jgi:ubiquinone/menaquinone biosynthesis C-methylase UbiE